MPPNHSSQNVAEIKEIAAIIGRLMNHFWLTSEPEPVRRAQIEDWLEDLVEFGSFAVAEACREWRRTMTRRPTPAEIRMLCIAARRERLDALPPPPGQPCQEAEPEPMSAEDRAYCIALADKTLAALRSRA